jgi:SAM-dependent methyltransferase
VPAPSEHAGSQLRLTHRAEWDAYWERRLDLPAEVTRQGATPFLRAILDVLDRHLPADPSLRALEIGGAPGQYLAYLHRTKGYRCACLDYSPVGIEAARRNFELLAIPLEAVAGDVLDDGVEVEPADVVMSLGLIEHFAALEAIVQRHVRLARPGGWLVLGCPNLLGINGWLARRLIPQRLASHHVPSMDLARWTEWEGRLGLQRLFRGYVGGFEPSVTCQLERRTPSSLAVYAALRALHVVVSPRDGRLRRLNSRWWSGYAIGVYRVAR